jgi:hypothetical protein
VVLAPINLLLRKRPQDMGLEPDGDAAPSASFRTVSNVVNPAWAATDWTLARAVRTARYWWLALGYFCGLYVWYTVQVHRTTTMLASLAGGAAGPFVTRVLHDITGTYTVAFILGIGVSVVAATTIWLASPDKVRAVAGRLHLAQSAVPDSQQGIAS